MIKSFLGTSVIEYPGKIASVVFIGGCNLRCPFCHNLELVVPELIEKVPDIPVDKVIEELIKRKGFIDGVSISGGEPLLSPEVPSFVKRIKEEVGIYIKIDTNGTLPDKLKEVLPYIDFISMDIKSSPEKYPLATGNKGKFKEVKDSVEIIKKTQDYEFRTTMVPGVVDKEDIRKICKEIGNIKRYVVQGFRNLKTLSPEYSEVIPYPKEILTEASEILKKCSDVVKIRE